MEFDEEGKVLSVEEKPKEPKSNYAIIDLYFYTIGVSNMAKSVARITTLNDIYLKEDKLAVELLGRGFA